MIPLNQSYRIEATLAARPEVRHHREAYEAQGRPGRSYDYAIALASIAFDGMDVLELGARDSYFAPYVTRWAKSVTVSDLFGGPFRSSGSIEEWGDRWWSAAVHPERLVIPDHGVDMRKTDYPDASFDVVVNISAIEHVSGDGDIQAAKEMGRIVRPGGFVVIGTDTAREFQRQSGHYYDEAALYERIIRPSGCTMYGPADLSWEPCDKSPHKSGKFDRSCCIFVLQKASA
jgi:SAM-dependent methyltransferase